MPHALNNRGTWMGECRGHEESVKRVDISFEEKWGTWSEWNKASSKKYKVSVYS